MPREEKTANEHLEDITKALRGGECSLAILPLLMRPGIAVQVKIKSRKIGPLLVHGEHESVLDTLTMIGDLITRTDPNQLSRGQMRDQCIAMEAAKEAGALNPGTFGEIANRAVATVDDWQARGELDVLFHSWTEDPGPRT